MKRVCQKTDECEHYLRLQEFIENTKAPITGDIPFDCCKEYNYKLEQELERYRELFVLCVDICNSQVTDYEPMRDIQRILKQFEEGDCKHIWKESHGVLYCTKCNMSMVIE